MYKLIEIVKILLLMFLLFSCKAKQSATISLDEAIASEDVVRLKISDSGPYRFEKLIRIDGKLYGLVKRDYLYANQLKEKVVDNNYKEKYKLIELEENNVHDIKKGSSPALAIALFCFNMAMLVWGIITLI